MMSTWTALIAGVLFGAGLTVGQMTNPAKVIGFLDVTGDWDPSLAFVMGAALVVSAIAHRVRAARAVGAPAAPAASASAGIDGRLLLGAALFGAGWGLAGFCPGPAVAALVTGSGRVLLFVASMIAGMGLYHLLAEPRTGYDETRAPVRKAA